MPEHSWVLFVASFLFSWLKIAPKQHNHVISWIQVKSKGVKFRNQMIFGVNCHISGAGGVTPSHATWHCWSKQDPVNPCDARFIFFKAKIASIAPSPFLARYFQGLQLDDWAPGISALSTFHIPSFDQAVIVLRLWLEGESRPSTCCLYSPLHHRWGQQSIDKYSNAFHQMATSKKQIASKYSEADTRLMLIRGALPPLLTTKESSPWPNQI